jgi:quercetin dioxygenase-like cupin family protein
MGPRIRRVITGHDQGGFSTVHLDESVHEGNWATVLWASATVPVDNAIDPAKAVPPATTIPGATFLALVFQPGQITRVHRSITADYGYVVSGEVELILDNDKTVTLRAGDTFVQRGTLHAWRNPGAEPCRAIVLSVQASEDVGRPGDWPRDSGLRNTP